MRHRKTKGKKNYINLLVITTIHLAIKNSCCKFSNRNLLRNWLRNQMPILFRL